MPETRANKSERYYREMIRLIAMGQSDKDIAGALGVSHATVARVRNNPAARDAIKRLQDEMDKKVIESPTFAVHTSIKQLAEKAVMVMEEVLNDQSAPVAARVKAAQDILDRAGFAPVREQRMLTGRLSDEEIERIKAKAEEFRCKALANVVDIGG